MKKLKIILQSNVTYVLLFLFLCIFVFLNVKVITHNSKFNDNETIISGKVKSYKIDDNKISLLVKSKENIICNYYFDNNKTIPNDLIGSEIRIVGKLNEPSNNTIPNMFNYKNYLYNNGIHYIFNIDNFNYKKSNNIFYKLKNIMYKRIEKDNKVNEYLNLFILGNKSLINKDTYDNYLSNGVVHLFAISGMHVSLLTYLLDKLLKIRKKKLIIIFFLWLYGFIVSFSISILRSIIFYSLKNIFNFLDIELSNIKLLFLTFCILVCINPFNIYNIGFLYSFITVLSIFYNADKISGSYISKLFKISIITFLFSLPITANINYEINLLSIFNNIIFIPLVTFIIYPFSIITYIFPIFNFSFELLISIMEMINFYVSKINFLTFIIPRMNFLMIIIYYIILLFKKKICIIIIILEIIFIKIIPSIEDNYNIYFLDVKQADSIVITGPFNKNIIMIDTGGNLFNQEFKITNNTIKFLKSKGIGIIHKLILTHGDYDHMGEAINLVENFKVEKVIFNCGEFNELEQELIKVLDKNKIPYYSCIKELNIDDNKLYFLNNNDYGNENDNSSVIYSELNNHKFLFMGDAGLEVEEDLLEKYNLKDIDVLKVGHHGSKTSSSKNFIDEINPKYSVISVGKNNRYGHPNKEVLNTLDNSKIYRTDQDGSIIFKIKNNKLELETCPP